MYFRILKTASAFAYLFLIWLSWQFVHGDLGWSFSFGCALVSAFWLLLTGLKMRNLFQTYFDLFSRLKVCLPLTFGSILAASSFSTADSVWLHVLAGLTFVSWGAIYLRYRHNRKSYMTQGHGPLPAGTWVSPPARALLPGDLILTSGRIATRLHESVGHGEVVVIGAKGERLSFSSYMERGCVASPLEDVAGAKQNHGHFVVMRLVKPLTDEQVKLSTMLMQVMLEQNVEYRRYASESREKMIRALWAPAFVKNFLRKKLRVTGYDWMGLLTGRRAEDRWTCIGACLELYSRLGIKTHQYGTGLLGLGTGLLDPIMPVRFLADPAFRILTVKDQAEFLKHDA